MNETKPRYTTVNGAWPAGELPKPSPEEAVAGARRLYRLIMKKPFKGRWKIAGGNRRTAIRRHVFYVNPDRRGFEFDGWRDIVHSMSHWLHWRLYPSHKPHDGRGTHAAIEREMIEFAVANGFLDGALKRPAKPKSDVRELRRDRVLARIATWEARERRAVRALAKLRKTASYYERTL